jgi:hypothetical protein
VQTIKTEAPSLSSSQPSTAHRDPRRIGLLGWLLTVSRLRLAWFYLVGIWRIYSAAIRSCRARIRLQSPIEIFRVGTGPAFAVGPDQSLQPNIRTLARACYIEMLSATLDWADIVDFRTFLMGFDAGEQWTHHTQRSEQQTAIEPLTWVSSNKNALARHLTLDMLKRHWYKSQYESVRPQNPSQSD